MTCRPPVPAKEIRGIYLAAKREEYGIHTQDKQAWKAVAEAGKVRAQARELSRVACESREKAAAKAELELEFIRLCRLEGRYGTICA
jgi:hypothetical protein